MTKGEKGGKGGRGGQARSSPERGRSLTQRVKTARGRTLSSTRWLERQLNDPYVAAAREQGYRSRAAFKLIEIDDRFGILRPGARVIDLGAAPGGWAQVAVQRAIGLGRKGGAVVAVDLTEIAPIEGATFIHGDFFDDATLREIRKALGGKADVVLSDMAAPSTGHRQTDHLRIMALCEAAFAFAEEVLEEGGAFVAKVLKGGTENALLAAMKQKFRSVRHAKPKASRQDSAEAYIVAIGYRGAKARAED